MPNIFSSPFKLCNFPGMPVFTTSPEPETQKPLPFRQKHTMRFLDKEDSRKESSIKFKPMNDAETDFNALPSTLDDGRPNFECPCLGSLPHGPCGEFFRQSFSCWLKYKDSPDDLGFKNECQPKFIAWTRCNDQYPDMYGDAGKNNRPSFLRNPGEN